MIMSLIPHVLFLTSTTTCAAHQAINQDPTKSRGEFEDISQVEKYEISSDEYAKRSGI